MSHQKQFFWRELPWVDPVQLLRNCVQEGLEPMFFLSGKTFPEKNGGEFSFLPFSPKKKIQFRKGTDYLSLLKKNSGPKRKIPEDAPKIFQAFCGGLCGFFSYEFAHELEEFSENHERNQNIPEAYFEVFDYFLAFDHLQNSSFLAGWFAHEQEAHEFFEHTISRILRLDSFDAPQTEEYIHIFRSELSEREYIQLIEKIKNELMVGNSYQINFSQKWTASTEQNSIDLFSLLVALNPAPMMFFLERENFSVLSCSPERLFSLSENTIFTQPIAGTRKRGKSGEEDTQLETELQENSKEMAEHSMLVDLLRNDFGRVAEFGTVQVEEFARVEKYTTVMHLVSDISAQISSEKNAFDVFRAVFPGGTITGAPKIETMDILGRYEKSSRGVYCGSAGYFSFNGNADFNILIRTLQRTGDELELRAGGGIVVDSEPAQEYKESIHKAQGVLRALGGEIEIEG